MPSDAVSTLSRRSLGGVRVVLCAFAVSLVAMVAAAPAHAGDDDDIVGLEGDSAFDVNMGTLGIVNVRSHSKVAGFGDGFLDLHYDIQDVDRNGRQLVNIVSNVRIPLDSVRITISESGGKIQFTFLCLNSAPCIDIVFDRYHDDMRSIDQPPNREIRSSAYFDPANARRIQAALCVVDRCSRNLQSPSALPRFGRPTAGRRRGGPIAAA